MNKQNFVINESNKIFRVDEEIQLEKFENTINKIKLSENEENIKLGEIIMKDSKYYFKPNLKELKNNNNLIKSDNNNSINETDNLSWLVYKGNKIPLNKNKYHIREGDIIKLGREWLLIKDIHLSNKTKKKIKINNQGKIGENQGIMLSFHTQTNQSLNLNDDFNFENNATEEEKDKDDLYKAKDNKEGDIKNNENNENKIKNNNININNKSDIKNKNVEKKEKDLISMKSEKNSEINKKKNKKICRICYTEELDKKNNPLIKPCKCSGSMKYIHYECLLHWLKTKVLINKNVYNNNGFFSIYSLNLIECELCKKHLPNYIRHKNKVYSLIDLEKKFNEDIKKPKKNEDKEGDLNIFNKKNKDNDNNYIIFDTITPGKKENKYRYLVKFDKNNIMKIGRALEMQLILNDISVSRNHCQLKIEEEDGCIIMEDNNSKFGTLVLIQAETIEILKGHVLTVQVGTNFLNIGFKKQTNIFGCCNAEEIDVKHSYEKINYLSIKYDKSNEILNESITPENSDDEEGPENINKDINKDLIDKDEEVKKLELKLNEEEKINDNKNNNFDSTYNATSLIDKNNKNENDKNIKNDIPTSIKLIQKGIEEVNSKENKNIKRESMKSDNIIVSDSDEDKKEEKNNIDNKDNISEGKKEE